MNISIGICAYNEEKNIEKILKALLNQKNQLVQINEIIIISSGSTDKTDNIVQKYIKKYKSIRLIRQKKREGKASAINIILKNATCDIIVLESADTVPTSETIENLVIPFIDADVGMTGGHPVPVDEKNRFIGFTVNLLWDLHHEICTQNPDNPKFGELIAFRKSIIEEINEETAVDEAWIQAIVKQKGFKFKYVPNAIVYNKGPANISDFLKQRRRIYAGHLDLKNNLGYELSTVRILPVFRIIINKFKFNIKYVFWTTGTIFLEGTGRFLGYYDYYIKKRKHYIWNIAESTKKVEKWS